jgi:hypothetical protein
MTAPWKDALDRAQMRRLGIIAVIGGTVVLSVGIAAAHFVGLPETNSLGQEIYPHVPRGWVWEIGAKLVGLAGSQILIAGIVLAWLWDREMTWARASVGAALFTMETIILMAIVPNEWLGLTQGEFQWTSQRVAFTVPGWLTLNNDLSISYGAIKDIVSGTYSAAVLGAILVTVYQVQERQKRGPADRPTVVSDYGRPVVKGGR